MRQYQQVKIWNQIKYSYMSIIIIFVITFLIIRENLFLLQKYLRMNEVRDKVEYDMIKTKSINKKAENKLDLIQSDRGVEEYVRLAYPVTKVGESVITLYNATSSNTIDIEMPKSVWQKISIWWNEIYNNAIIDYTNTKK